MSSNAAIEHLDAGTRSRLRSTQILTSLPQIIAELVQNSLDAGAKHVDVGIDCEEWSCWVRDDGAGISKDGLAIIAQGSDGGRYATSKVYNPSSLDSVSTFGFRGEAIASAVDVSCIEISSRTKRSKESWSVIMKGGDKLYIGPSMRWRREMPGTVVSIRDAFYNLPIRRLSHSSSLRTLELVRKDLESYALVSPHVSFSLEDTAKERKAGSGKGRITSIPKTPSTLAAFRHIYGRALVEHVHEITAQLETLRLEGFLSLIGAHSKAYQFLYVNNHLLDPCDLHRIIEQKFTSSSFGKHAYDESGETNSRPASRRSPRKAERRPVYVLHIHVPSKELDNCLNPAKTAVHFQNNSAVSSLIGGVVQSFLAQYGFYADRQTEGEDSFPSSPLPRKKRKILDNFDDTVSPTAKHTSAQEELPDIGCSRPSTDRRAITEHIYVYEGDFTTDETKLSWTDATTGQTFLIDSRTGNSYLRRPHLEVQKVPGCDSARKLTRRILVDTHSLKRMSDKCHEDRGNDKPGMPEWIESALRSNGAFANTEASVPERMHQCSNDHHFDPGGATAVNPHWMSKDDLARSQVIDQIDRKFIACLVEPTQYQDRTDQDEDEVSHGKVLILIDQHAADERVRVEEYLKALCQGFLGNGEAGVEKRMLDPPKPVLLTKIERSRLIRSQPFREAFARWGFTVFDLPRPYGELEADGEDAYDQVSFASLPEVVCDKLLVGEELRELVKGYLARLETEGEEMYRGQQSDHETPLDAFDWLKALRWCPRELVDLVNSRACRGAIMFNDTLSQEQCSRLIYELSQTAFPFQCAHGRPSVVSLAKFGTGVDEVVRKIDWCKLDGG